MPAHVQGQEADHQPVAEDPVELHDEGPDVLGAPRGADPVQLLEGDRRRVLVVHRGEVVHGVDVGQRGGVRRVLAQLLDAAVEVAEDRVEVGDDLAADLDHQAHDAMGGRVLRPHVHEHLALFEGVHLALALGLRRPIRDARPARSRRTRPRPARRARTQAGGGAQARLLGPVEVDADRGCGASRSVAVIAGRLPSATSSAADARRLVHVAAAWAGSSRPRSVSSRVSCVRSHVSGRSRGFTPAAGESAASSGRRKSRRCGKSGSRATCRSGAGRGSRRRRCPSCRTSRARGTSRRPTAR